MSVCVEIDMIIYIYVCVCCCVHRVYRLDRYSSFSFSASCLFDAHSPFADPASGVRGRCPDGTHTFKVEKALVCRACGECTSKGKGCYRASRKDKQPGEPCGCGAGDAGCSVCGICRACDKPGSPSATKVTVTGPLALPADIAVLQIMCGDSHTLALLADGSVYGLGDNSDGQVCMQRVLMRLASIFGILSPFSLILSSISARSGGCGHRARVHACAASRSRRAHWCWPEAQRRCA